MLAAEAAAEQRKLHDARQKFFALQFLLRTRLELGESGQDMRASARLLWRERAFGDGVAGADRLFGHAREGLARVPMSEWLMLLMNALIIEYNVAVLGLHEFRPAWGLRVIRTRIQNSTSGPWAT